MNSEELCERWLLYMRYALMKATEGEMHGLADAAMDMRDMLAANPEFRPPAIHIKMTVL